jgi:hypothetical protein
MGLRILAPIQASDTGFAEDSKEEGERKAMTYR